MFTKPITDLTIEDLAEFVQRDSGDEGYHVEYKDFIKGIQAESNNLCIAVSAFANSYGGYLILGVDDKSKIFTGIEDKVGNQYIKEWLNQVISENIVPQVYYPDPVLRYLDNGSSKCIIIVQIPESKNKPHQVSKDKPYYVRINNRSKPAEHFQVRDMFEFSRNRQKDHVEYLKKRNLEDEDSENFGENNNSNKLALFEPRPIISDPKVLFSAIPIEPYKIKFNESLENLDNIIRAKLLGKSPYEQYCTFKIENKQQIKLDGIIYKNIFHKGLNKYLEVMTNGFIEIGGTTEFTGSDGASNGPKRLIFASKIVFQNIMFLNFIKQMYESYNLVDDVNYQISLVNINRLTLGNFHRNWQMPYPLPTNTEHKNLKINFHFRPRELTLDMIEEISKSLSLKLCNGFGLLQDYIYYKDAFDESCTSFLRI